MDDLKTTDLTLLSTDELEALVQKQADQALINAVLDELVRREGDMHSQTDAAWQNFKIHYLPIEGKDSIYAEESTKVRTFSLRRTLSAAAVAAMIACTLVVHAGGTKGLATMARWTVDGFSFGDTLVHDEPSLLPPAVNEDAAHEAASSPAAPGGAGEAVQTEELQPAAYTSLSDALEAFGAPELLPTVLPESFTFRSADLFSTAGWEDLHVVFEDAEGQLLQFSYSRVSPDAACSAVVMKDDRPVEVYEREGITHYFFSNGRYEVAAWKTDDWTECRISGPVSRDTLKAAVDSMYP